MPSLDWTPFYSLPGDKAQNFENLCRALVRLNFGSFGHFTALKNQPGVEFHLKLSKSCLPLGDPPRWYGWQCKLHSLAKNGDLLAASKRDIEDSLSKTKQHLPKLTDWVLWTPYTLSKKDQNWLNNLQTDFTLHQWAAEEIDTYLSGPGLELRSTYFGELIATPVQLGQWHEEAIQPIQDRWFQPVHQLTDAERTIRRMLGEPGHWEELIAIGKRLEEAVSVISGHLGDMDSEMKGNVTSFVTTCSAFASTLLNFHKTLADGDIDFIQQELREKKTRIHTQIQSVPRELRAADLPIALDATNALEDLHVAQERLNEVEEFLGVGLVALLADAGGGKTQIAAQITAAQEDRPAGILLHGRNFHKGQTLSNLASSFSLNANPLSGMEQLLAVIDSTGKRARCRLPIVIDGLNEAENPRDWKTQLETLGVTVKCYPNVLVVCTLRTGEHSREDSTSWGQTQTDIRESFAIMALPESVQKIESRGFGHDAENAIGKYFDYYKIVPSSDTEIPVEFFRHPLTLQIFCKVTNPRRESEVTVDFFPASLSSLLEKYVDNACHRISQLPNLSHPYTAEDVHRAIYNLGLALWKARRREIDESVFSEGTADTGHSWESNIVNLLMQEGIIFRNPGRTPYDYVVTPSYDYLGGFIVADSLLKKHTRDLEFTWVREPDFIQAFKGENSHELADDIFRSLVTLFPRRLHGSQLWKVGPASFRNPALRFATHLDTEYLDQETVSAIRTLLQDNAEREGFLFSRLELTQGSARHPFNADFLDSVLRPMSVFKRDSSWTEWIRTPGSAWDSYLIKTEARWEKNINKRTPPNRLRARWIMWLLTSTNRKLRDMATRALYWFGRGDPRALFEDTIRSLEINDPYVPERMLAASYGVAMALHTDLEDFTNTTLLEFARKLYDSLFSIDASFSTTHALIREYATRTIELAIRYNPNGFSCEEIERSKPPFIDGGCRWWEESDASEERFSGPNSPFRMDFENYTLGYLVPERQNYDYKHPEFRKVRAQILWRIEQLGWSNERFGMVDSSIERSFPWGRSHDHAKIERYGKKYSWIAYFEMVGLRGDLGKMGRNNEESRELVVDIDPSFPLPVPTARIIDVDFLDDPEIETQQWVANEALPEIVPYLKLPEVMSEKGPWIMLHGFVSQGDKSRDRSIFCCIQSFFVVKQHADAILAYLTREKLGGLFPRIPSLAYTFAGEIPWCSTFPANGPSEVLFITEEESDEINESSNIFNVWSDVTDRTREVRYEILSPVRDFAWESYHSAVNDAGHATTLAKEIALGLDLVGQPQTFDLFTHDKKKATLCVSDHGDDVDNTQSMHFIREDILKPYLTRNDYSLIWVMWGERRGLIQNQFFKKFRMAKPYNC